ncbi:MAG TPA: DUF11 domain-containing protein, partial [Roseiflexaceae bacterium]|nr:DUF11 domain-containing protein [Roseiflexaceae bacterium]
TGVVLTDMLPAGLAFVSATPSQGSYTSATGVWNVGTLANGASATLQIVATVTQPGAITNTASVSGSDQFDPDAANDSGSASLNGQQADLSIEKFVDDEAPNVGANVTYIIQVSNSGPNAASGVEVTDLLPTELTFVSATPSQGSYTSATGLWNVGSLANGATATLQIVATVTQPGSISNSATITASDQPDPDSTNNTSTATMFGHQADLAITKTVDNATPNVGTNVTFTVQVGNNGPSTATGVEATDLLPAGLAFVSANPAAAYDSATGIWTVDSVDAGASATLQIVASVTQPGAITNSATISAVDQPDPDSTNNNASVTVTGQQADLAITKSASTATASIGANVTFSIQVSNNGPSDAGGVVVSDVLPAGLSLVSATPSQGSYTSATGVWNVGSLANGSFATLTIVATVTQPGSIMNTAAITSGDQPDPNAANNTSSATVTGLTTDLALTKSVNQPQPNVGNNVTFTVTIANNGPGDATGIVVSDLLPAGLTFISATTSNGSIYTAGSGAWNVGTLANGAGATLQIVARVDQAGTITNQASITASDQPDPNSANNSASASLGGQLADLMITKTVDNDITPVGSQVTFTIVVTNNGPSDASGVAVTDALPYGLNQVSASATTGSYSGDVWTIGNLANGASATLTVVATMTVADTVVNTATISNADQPDPDSSNNESWSSVTGLEANLTIAKSVDNTAPNVGDTVTYTIVVSNNGPSDTTGVVVSDPLPAGLAFVSAQTSAGSYATQTGLWSVGDLG